MSFSVFKLLVHLVDEIFVKKVNNKLLVFFRRNTFVYTISSYIKKKNFAIIFRKFKTIAQLLFFFDFYSIIFLIVDNTLLKGDTQIDQFYHH